MEPARIELRPGTPADWPHIARCHREAMGPHIEVAWGHFDAEAQRERLEASTDPTQHEIVLLEGRVIGCLWVRTHPDTLELVRLWILPEAQRRGIGGQLVARLCVRADAESLPVRLRVLCKNPARALYERHGFEVVGETETHFQMRRAPRPQA
ncbi:MAG: GNAT family N-acetyltransferase [Myxococcota bacterium]|nr:GNAT family N-acetyltransferase [Myxococcota bacterium]